MFEGRKVKHTRGNKNKGENPQKEKGGKTGFLRGYRSPSKKRGGSSGHQKNKFLQKGKVDPSLRGQ